MSFPHPYTDRGFRDSTGDTITQGAVYIKGFFDSRTYQNRVTKTDKGKYKANLGPHYKTDVIVPHQLVYSDKSFSSFSDAIKVLSTLNKGFKDNQPDYEVIRNIQFIGYSNGTAANMDLQLPQAFSIIKRGKVKEINRSPFTINIGDDLIWDIPDEAEVEKNPNKNHTLFLRPYRRSHERLDNVENFLRVIQKGFRDEYIERDDSFPLYSGAHETLQAFASIVVASLHILGETGFISNNTMRTIRGRLLNIKEDMEKPQSERNFDITTARTEYSNFLSEQDTIDMFLFLADQFGAHSISGGGTYEETIIQKKAKIDRDDRISPGIMGMRVENMNMSYQEYVHKVLLGTPDYIPYKATSKSEKEVKVHRIFAEIIDKALNGIHRGNKYFECRIVGTALSTAAPGQAYHVYFKT